MVYKIHFFLILIKTRERNKFRQKILHKGNEWEPLKAAP